MRIIAAFIICLLTIPAWAAGNFCYHPAHFQTVPHDKPSTITLSAGSVRRTQGSSLLYDLGRETITIVADSAAAHHFVSEINDRRCGAQVKVRLVPCRKSKFNTRFKAM